MAVGDPAGDDLCSGTTNGNTLPVAPNDGEEREITFVTPVELTYNIKYVIIVRALSGDGSNFAAWFRKTSDNYANGNQLTSVNSGSTWLPSTTTDMRFVTKADGVAKDSHDENDVSSSAVHGVAWQAQSFTASSTYTISSVVLKLNRVGSPGIITVSIKKAETTFTPPSDMITYKRLVAAANSKIWYEDI